MSDIAIKVENLSKLYRIGVADAQHDTLVAASLAAIRNPVRNLRRLRGLTRFGDNGATDDGTLWALKDVSFEVKRGEVVGVIGRNGAGKSTLLKILSRITHPTHGRVELHGRVSSLLEVGTGFHPELTGRENVYLNGTILGMRKVEIDRKFDEIVDFSGIEKFIDTPVKRYSSGMGVRLAFSVAAHLEPEILLVDEVLAVGDAEFQRKCLGKMETVANEGRAVLFVSHNMPSVGRLCPRSILIEDGTVRDFDSSEKIIRQYLSALQSTTHKVVWREDEALGDEYLRILAVELVDSVGLPIASIHQDTPFTIAIRYKVLQDMPNANVGFRLQDDAGTIVFSSYDADNPSWSGRGRAPGVYLAECHIPALFLNSMTYTLTVEAGIPHHKLCVRIEPTLIFQVSESPTGDGAAGRMGARRDGLLDPEMQWHVVKESDSLSFTGDHH